jgi:proteasome lid subunit RPN8/RPN11
MESIGLDPCQPFPAAGLRLSDVLYQQALHHLIAVAPYEAVGLIAVTPYAVGEMAVAMHFYPGTNVDTSTTRYTMAPAEVIAAFHDIDAHGWWLGAIMHSHPTSAPLPSATDVREAYYPNALCVIVSLTTGPPAARAWQMDDPSQSREVPLVIEPDELIPGQAPPDAEQMRQDAGTWQREDGPDGGNG